MVAVMRSIWLDISMCQCLSYPCSRGRTAVILFVIDGSLGWNPQRKAAGH